MSQVDKLIKKQKYQALSWLTLAALILVADYLTGPFIQFPILYLIPIGLASWYSGRGHGLAFALVMPLVRLSFSTVWPVPWTLTEAGINAAIRIIVFSGFAYLIDRVVTYKHELEKELHVLKGILPICSFCKKIRNQDGNWEVLENYLTTHSEAEFSHGLCPECFKQHYPDYFEG